MTYTGEYGEGLGCDKNSNYTFEKYSSTPCSLALWGPRHLVASSTFIVKSPHLPLSSSMVFHSWPIVNVLSRSCFTLFFHRSFGLLLPPSSAFHVFFDSLPPLILYPAPLILLPSTFILDVFSCQFILTIPSSSFYLLGLLCIFFEPSCFLLFVSFPVSLSVQCSQPVYRGWHHAGFQHFSFLIVSSVFCPT